MKSLAVLALLFAACKPSLTALSVAPPGRTGWFDSDHRTLDVSPGVAIAFDCQKWNGGPCRRATAVSEHPEIADVMPAHLARLEARVDWDSTSMVPPSSFVVLAHAAGTTAVHVRSSDGDRTLMVTVR